MPPAKSQRGKSSDPNLDGVDKAKVDPAPQPSTSTQSHSRLNTSFKGGQPAINNFISTKR